MHRLLAVPRDGVVEGGLVDEEPSIGSPGVGLDESTEAYRADDLTG